MFVELDPGIEFMLSVTIWAGLFHGCVIVKKNFNSYAFFLAVSRQEQSWKSSQKP